MIFYPGESLAGAQPLPKAHVICKIINVQNDAKLAHTNVRAIKTSKAQLGIQKDLQFWQQVRNALHTKSLITVSRFTLHGITPLYTTSCIIHQPITRKKSIPHRACFLTIRAWIQWFVFYSFLVPLDCSSTRPQVYSQGTSFPLNVSHIDVLSYVQGSRIRWYVVQIGAKTQADARGALSGALMLTCNKIQNWFTKITCV